MRTWRRPARPLAWLLALIAALGLTMSAAFASPLAISAEPLPDVSLLPSLPIPPLPLPTPSLPTPSLPLPSVPLPSVPLPSISSPPSVTLPSLPANTPSPTTRPPTTGGSASPVPASATPARVEPSAAASDLPTPSPLVALVAPPTAAPGAGWLGPIGLPQLAAAGSVAFLAGLLGLYLAASAGWLAVARHKLGGIGLRVTTWREERLRERHPGA